MADVHCTASEKPSKPFAGDTVVCEVCQAEVPRRRRKQRFCGKAACHSRSRQQRIHQALDELARRLPDDAAVTRLRGLLVPQKNLETLTRRRKVANT